MVAHSPAKFQALDTYQLLGWHFGQPCGSPGRPSPSRLHTGFCAVAAADVGMALGEGGHGTG